LIAACIACTLYQFCDGAVPTLPVAQAVRAEPLRDAERVLEAAATRAAMNTAASKVMLAEVKLKQLQDSPRTAATAPQSPASVR
jgi:hypothetical protein